jgi:serine/threonine protein kinase
MALSRLQDENIVRVWDFGRLADGSLYLEMEHIEGPDLHDRVSMQGPLNLLDGLKVLMQVASALEYAHGQGIVHRDLKPANIILQESNPDWVKIIDFGLVKLVSEEVITKLTKDNQVLGTPLFMSPEQCMSSDVTPAADIYTLGGIAYYIFSGDAVFPGMPPMATVVAHYEREPDRLSGRCPYLGIPEELDELLLRCLAKKAEDRPSADELVSGLQSILALVARGVADGTLSPTLSYETDKDAPRWVAQVIWQWSQPRRDQDSKEVVDEADAVKDALVNQVTAILMELCDHLHLYLSDSDWVASEIDAIQRAEDSVTDLAIEKALVDSQLEDAPREKPKEVASFRYRQRQLREHVKYLTHGLTQRYMSLYDEVIACRPQVSDPAILSKYEEMEGLIDRYLQLLSDQRGRT